MNNLKRYSFVTINFQLQDSRKCLKIPSKPKTILRNLHFRTRQKLSNYRIFDKYGCMLRFNVGFTDRDGAIAWMCEIALHEIFKFRNI